MRSALAALACAALLLGCHGTGPAAAPPARAAQTRAPTGDAPETPPSFFAGPPDGRLHVYFFDVGQGDAALVVSPTGTTALIDAGSSRTATHLVHRLPELLRDTPDWLVLTDPKPEHLGGMADVLAAFGAKRFLDPGLPSPSPAYQAMVSALQARQILRVAPTPDPRSPGEPVHYDLGGGAVLTVFWPRVPVEEPIAAGDAFPDANALVMRLSYGQTSVFFASDMTAATERYLLERRLPFRSTLLKVADHGSAASSTPELLAAIAPRAAIVTAGQGAREGLPSPDMLARLEGIHAHVFRTDLDGEVQAVSDGNAFTVTAERAVAGEAPGTPHVFADTGAAADASAGASSDGRDASAADTSSSDAERRSERESEARMSLRALPKSVRYVASRHSKVFHLPTCRSAQRIKVDNLVTFKTRSEALKRFKPATDCHP